MSASSAVDGSWAGGLGVDVSSDEGLRGALVLVAEVGWDSPVGVAVARAVEVELPGRVGAGVVASMGSGSAGGRGEVVDELVLAAWELLMLRPDTVARVEGDLWAWLARRARWAVADALTVEGLHGLCGDGTASRLRRRCRGVVFEGPEALEGPGVAPVGGGGVDSPGGRHRRAVVFARARDLGPVLGGVARAVAGVVPPFVDAAGAVARVAEIAGGARHARRHALAGRDGGAGGVLAGLGVGPVGARALMTLVAGSKRAGEESSVPLAVRAGAAVADEPGSWPEPARRALGRLAVSFEPVVGEGGQLCLFELDAAATTAGGGWCEPAA